MDIGSVWDHVKYNDHDVDNAEKFKTLACFLSHCEDNKI
jgi:hypothetical protein